MSNYLVGVLCEHFMLNGNVKVYASSYDQGCIGFMPVYKTKKQAEKSWPGAQITAVSNVKPGENSHD